MTAPSRLVLTCTLKSSPADSSSELLGSQALNDVGFTVPAQA